ncbi:MAG: ABC transporter permease [Thiotrichales bacterium]
MRALTWKLLRDLWRMRGQAVAIAAVLSAGIASYVTFVSTLQSLESSRQLYYDEFQFADVFASLTRAPNALAQRLKAVPGVERLQTRVVAAGTVEVQGFHEPIIALINSVPDVGEASLNRFFLMRGRRASDRGDEVMISDAFVNAHGLELGDEISLTIKGHKKKVRIVGIGGSPEYIYQLRPGSVFPDFKRYAVMWMPRRPLAAAYEMEGAFNSVVASTGVGFNPESVIDRFDILLKPYGGIGAYARKDQLSHAYLEQEMQGLQMIAGLFPSIFLGVSAFLLNVVISRLIDTQREQIAALKAFGYSNYAIALHYLELVLLIVAVGLMAGLVMGFALGFGLARIYAFFFHLPALHFQMGGGIYVRAMIIAVIAALAGALVAVRRAVRLEPAVAMRPEAPARFDRSMVEKVGLQRWMGMSARMIIRHIAHRPVKTLLSIIGIALSCAILMTGRFQQDTVNYMMHVNFSLAQREDLTVTFVEVRSSRVLEDLKAIAGVDWAEPIRMVPVRLVNGHRRYDTVITGTREDGEMRRVLDEQLQDVGLPAEGLLLSTYLAELLDIKPGERISVELRAGDRRTITLPVVQLVTQYVGVGAYMRIDALNRALRDGDTVSGALLYVDSEQLDGVYQKLLDAPMVAGTSSRTDELANFQQMMQEMMLYWAFISTFFASLITFGVIYNNARILLTEQSRELASLRVLGFTRGEVSTLFVGELALLTILAIPFGLVLGVGLCSYIAAEMSTDLYRIPLILESQTYAFAITVVLLAAGASVLFVRRHLNKLSLTEALKTRD